MASKFHCKGIVVKTASKIKPAGPVCGDAAAAVQLNGRTYAYSGTMAKLWSLKGLSWRELAKRTCRKSWDDEVFGQAARLAFYYFLSLFPVLLLLLILFDKLAGTGSDLRSTLLGAFQQILPRGAAALIAKTAVELNAGAVIGVGAVAAGLASAWGALNGTWAMMTGLNKAYEVNEERPLVEGFEYCLRLDDCAGDHGLGCALCNALWKPGRKHAGPGFWHSCPIPISLAHHTVAGDSGTAALLVRSALSLRAEFKGSAVAMEHPRCGHRSNVMDWFRAAVSSLRESLQFSKNLWRPECGGYSSAVAIFHRRGYLYRRRGQL